jgi:hypothetical protein
VPDMVRSVRERMMMVVMCVVPSHGAVWTLLSRKNSQFRRSGYPLTCSRHPRKVDFGGLAEQPAAKESARRAGRPVPPWQPRKVQNGPVV